MPKYDSNGFLKKPKHRGKHGHSKAAGPSFDRPSRRGPTDAPFHPDMDTPGPRRGPNGPLPHHTSLPERSRKPPRDTSRDSRGSTSPGPSHYPAARDPYHGLRPPTSRLFPERPNYLDRARLFDEKKGVHRSSKDLYDEARLEVSVDTGTEYPCTQRDLDACGGKSRGVPSQYRDFAELRALWFSEPNRMPKVSIREAALDIVDHNSSERNPSAKENDAIDRLWIMLDNALQGYWSPDVAIKCLCDLDIVFFRGELKGHVCITWAGRKRFPSRTTWGHTGYIGHGKAVIELNANYILLEPDRWHKNLLNQTIATMLHEMW